MVEKTISNKNKEEAEVLNKKSQIKSLLTAIFIIYYNF